MSEGGKCRVSSHLSILLCSRKPAAHQGTRLRLTPTAAATATCQPTTTEVQRSPQLHARQAVHPPVCAAYAVQLQTVTRPPKPALTSAACPPSSPAAAAAPSAAAGPARTAATAGQGSGMAGGRGSRGEQGRPATAVSSGPVWHTLQKRLWFLAACTTKRCGSPKACSCVPAPWLGRPPRSASPPALAAGPAAAAPAGRRWTGGKDAGVESANACSCLLIGGPAGSTASNWHATHSQGESHL